MLKTKTKSNILVLFTGGTIGSTSKDGVIDVANNSSLLLQLFRQRYSDFALHVNLSTDSILSRLSENITTNDIETMIQAIEKHCANYDGIILTHGTDTLAFSAATLALYFNTISIPLILVSSHTILEDRSSNGVENFYVALEYIHQKQQAGVFVSYKNSNEKSLLHQALEITQSPQLSSRFESIHNNYYMHFENSKFTAHSPYTTIRTSAPTLTLQNVSIIYPHVTLDYDTINLLTCKSILHTTYHSGTVNEKVLIFIEKCLKNNIPIFFCGIMKNQQHYASTQKLIDSGANILYDTTLEVAYASLLLGIEILE